MPTLINANDFLDESITKVIHTLVNLYIGIHRGFLTRLGIDLIPAISVPVTLWNVLFLSLLALP
jgi:HAE1 family hydrophobic/amphiphilic exporter-1